MAKDELDQLVFVECGLEAQFYEMFSTLIRSLMTKRTLQLLKKSSNLAKRIRVGPNANLIKNE